MLQKVMRKSVELSNGVSMPLVGLGTYKTRGRDLIFSVVKAALEAGYRSFDTAAVYRNEKELGEALHHYLPQFNLTREDIFITSKLSPNAHGFDESQKALEVSLANLQVTYLDLYLIHWPAATKLRPDDSRNKEMRAESWKGLEGAYKRGQVRAVGVSNYTVAHLQQLIDKASITPHVNQVEFHPHYLQEELRAFCEKEGIHLQAYSSLGTSVQPSPLLQEPTVSQLATRLTRTPAQILLRWAIQQGVGVLPKSTSGNHIRENIQLDFDLSDKDLATLSSLDVTRKYAWDPSPVL